MALKDKYQLDIRNDREIPFSSTDEAQLKSIINTILTGKIPEAFVQVLKKNLKAAGLLQVNRLSADEVSSKTLLQRTTTQAEKHSQTIENLQDRINTDVEISFSNFKPEANAIIESLQDLQRGIEPLAMQNCQQKIAGNAEEIEQLQTEMTQLSADIKRHVLEGEQPEKIDSTLLTISTLAKTLSAIANNLDDFKDSPELKAFTKSMQSSLDTQEKLLDKVRDISYAVTDKLDVVSEQPAVFQNAYISVTEIANPSPGKEKDIVQSAEDLQESQSNMVEARKAINELREMKTNLAQKNTLGTHITTLQENIKILQDKMAIVEVIGRILGNLDVVLGNKKPSWYTIGLGGKLDAIESARAATLANLDSVVNTIYKNLKTNANTSTEFLFKSISDGLLIHGSQPSIQDQLKIERPTLGKSHLVEKLGKENQQTLRDKSSDLNTILKTLGTSLQTTGEKVTPAQTVSSVSTVKKIPH